MKRCAPRSVTALAIACALVVSLLGPEVAPARAASHAVTPVAAIEEKPSTVGIAEGADLYFMSDSDIARTLDAMQSLGVDDVRIAIFWADIESEEGVFDWDRVDRMVEAATRRGMGILGTMLYTPEWAGTGGLANHPDPAKWGSFVAAVAERYRGRISAYEIWNEPTTTLFWDPVDPTVYTALLKAGYRAIKDVDASAVVIAGSVVAGPTRPDGSTMSPVDFLQGMYDAGAHGFFDAISYHPYLFSMPFSGGQNQPHFDYPIEQLDAMRALMVAHGDGDLKVWITEYGQPTTTLADGSVLTEAQQAAFLTDLLRTWQSVTGAGPVFLYNLRDTQTGSSNPDNNLGLYQSNWTPKYAAEVLAALIRELNPQGSADNPVVALVKRIVRAIGDAITFIPNLIGRVVRTVVNLVGDVLGVNSAARDVRQVPEAEPPAQLAGPPEAPADPARERRTVSAVPDRPVPTPDDDAVDQQPVPGPERDTDDRDDPPVDADEDPAEPSDDIADEDVAADLADAVDTESHDEPEPAGTSESDDEGTQADDAPDASEPAARDPESE